MPEKKEAAVPSAIEPLESTLPLDTMIASLDGLYQALTGRSAPAPEAGGQRPLPVERDPAEFVGEQMERLLRALEQPRGAGAFSPPLAVWQGSEELLIAVDVPGAKREQLEVTVDARTVLVRGRRALARDGFRLALCERPLGGFERRIVLPERADPESLKASLVDGVLELRIAQRETESSARREVRVA